MHPDLTRDERGRAGLSSGHVAGGEGECTRALPATPTRRQESHNSGMPPRCRPLEQRVWGAVAMQLEGKFQKVT